MRVFDGDNEIRTRDFDYNDEDLRKWFTDRLSIWALTKGHAVELVKVDAD